MAPKNPFNYGTPVEGEQFVGREDEVGAVVGRIRDHVNVVLLSPRRYGKTSILLRGEQRRAQLVRASRHRPHMRKSTGIRADHRSCKTFRPGHGGHGNSEERLPP